ncbi:hypothetical protein F4861DRAFT_525383 [Xylaria intraflava]|nr:hypothetical protein F4861DRAFT_525383 [Xylaria intraflava]
MMYSLKALSMAILLGVSLAQTTTTTSGGAGADCTRSYAKILAGAPTPPAQLASAITSFAGGFRQTGSPNANPLSEACEFSSGLPSTLRSDFDAYATKVISYVSVSSSEIDALITNCVATGAQGASLTSIVNSLATHTGALCQATGITNGTTTATSAPTTTQTGGVGTGTATGTTATTSPATTTGQTGAGSKPTGVLAGAAAAAGVLGAAVLL